MSDLCQFDDCEKVAYDECINCGEPTCKRHGREVGDAFVCLECMDDYLDDLDVDEDEEYG